MKQLTKIQKYAIEYLASQGKSDIEIATELKINRDEIIKYMEKSGKTKTDTELPTKQSKITSHDMMIRKTRDKQINNVSIMTKEAAMYNDDYKSKQQQPKSQSHIHKIR